MEEVLLPGVVLDKPEPFVNSQRTNLACHLWPPGPVVTTDGASGHTRGGGRRIAASFHHANRRSSFRPTPDPARSKRNGQPARRSARAEGSRQAVCARVRRLSTRVSPDMTTTSIASGGPPHYEATDRFASRSALRSNEFGGAMRRRGA